jgi:hypothetical protein
VSVNLKQLSAMLALSQTTVSRALNGYPEVNEETRRRVMDAAKRHGYRPNPSARRLATGKAGMIGYVMPTGRRSTSIRISWNSCPAWAIMPAAMDWTSSCRPPMRTTRKPPTAVWRRASRSMPSTFPPRVRPTGASPCCSSLAALSRAWPQRGIGFRLSLHGHRQ